MVRLVAALVALVALNLSYRAVMASRKVRVQSKFLKKGSKCRGRRLVISTHVFFQMAQAMLV